MPRSTIRILAVAAAMGVAAWGLSVFADAPDDGPNERPRRSQSQDGPPPGRPEGRPPQDSPPRRPPPPPLEIALDQDHNHEISAAELEAATANLTKLDKNGDGKLSPDEYRPLRPEQLGRGPGPGPGLRDGDGPRKGRGPRDGDGAKSGGDCPKGQPGEKQKSPGNDE